MLSSVTHSALIRYTSHFLLQGSLNTARPATFHATAVKRARAFSVNDAAVSPACRSYEFRCASGAQCVPQAWRCDGETDCLDASDEQQCATPCGPAQVSCLSGDQCVNRQSLCDGTPHCRDASDESVDNCGNSKSAKASFLRPAPTSGLSVLQGRFRYLRVWEASHVTTALVSTCRKCATASQTVLGVKTRRSVVSPHSPQQRRGNRWMSPTRTNTDTHRGA